jgi:hypothetical protein
MLRGGQSTLPKPYQITTHNPNITIGLGPWGYQQSHIYFLTILEKKLKSVKRLCIRFAIVSAFMDCMISVARLMLIISSPGLLQSRT